MLNMNQMQTLPIRKFLHQILQEKYDSSSDEVVQRMLSGLALESDLKKAVALFEGIYYAGFNSAVDQYRVELEKLGKTVRVVQKEEPPEQY